MRAREEMRTLVLNASVSFHVELQQCGQWAVDRIDLGNIDGVAKGC